MKKVLLLAAAIFCLISALSGAEKSFVDQMSARPGVLKVFTMPKPVTF